MLVGRADELDLIAATTLAAPAFAVVEGEAGIGKSRLLSELRDRPEVADQHVLVGACRHIREPFPLGPIIDALRARGPDLADREVPAVTGALHPLLPELEPVLPPRLEPLDDRAAERHRVFRGLHGLLNALGPVVLAVEDAHWIDEQTCDFLRYLLADPPSRLTTILTYRGEEVAPEVRTLATTLPESVGQLHLTLAPLDASQTGELTAALLDVESVSAEFAAYLCERASGLPFAIQELIALLRARGSLVRHGERWARRALGRLDVPAKIRDQVLERVDGLTPNARAASRAAAVLQLPAPVSVIVAASALPEQRAVSALDEAIESGLLVDRDGEVGFRHLLAMQAVYESVPLPRRQELHRRAAAALRELPDPPAGQVAHHLRRSDNLDAWATAAEEAAAQALALGHDDEAARLLEDVLRDAPLDAERRGRVALTLGRAAVEATRSAGSADLLMSILDAGQDLPAIVRGELRLLLGRLLAHAGIDPERRRRLYADAIPDLDDRPDLKATAMVGLAVPMSSDTSAAERKHWANEALRLQAAADDPDAVFVVGKIATVLMWSGDPQWHDVAADLQRRIGTKPRHRLEVDAYCSIGMGACYPGHYETAERLLTSALAGAIDCASPLLELRARLALTLLDHCRGSWTDLTERLDDLVVQLTDYAPARIDAEALASCLGIARGDTAALPRLVELTTRAADLGASDLPPPAIGALARLATDRASAEMTRTASRLMSVLESQGVWAPGVRVLPHVTEAILATERIDRARDLVDRWAGELTGLDAPLAPAALDHAHGFLAMAERRWSDAAERFLAAAETYEQLGCPYETAQALEQAAAARAADPDEPDAADPLRSAVATYGRLGARWDLDRASGLARRHGIPLPARHRRGRRGYGDDLSPREEEVAALAAAGHTNKEIADRLFLSPNTVKRHLTAAMRKLDMRSRVDLIRHFDPDGDPASAANE